MTPITGEGVAEIRRHGVMLLGATLGSCVSITGLFTYTNSVFFADLHQALGWSNSRLSLVALAFTLAVACALPLAGMALDRFGSRRPIAVSFAAVVACYLALALAPAVFPLYLGLHVLLGALGAACTTVGFSRLASAWFDPARGLAMGAVVAGLGLVAIGAPPALSQVMHDHGWRAGYLSLAGAVAIGAALCLWLVGPDPAAPAHSGGAGIERAAAASFLRSRAFWTLLASFVLLVVFSSGYLTHLIALLKLRGFSALAAGGVAAILGAGLLVGRLISGWLMDRLFAPYVGAGAFLLFSAALVMLASGFGPLLAPSVFVIGLAFGSELDILGYLTSRYFGVADFGKVYGVLYGVTFVAGGVSPMVITWLAGQPENYNHALTVSAMILPLAAGLLLTAPRFPGEAVRRRPAGESAPEPAAP